MATKLKKIKMKTSKSVKKRFKITKNGKVLSARSKRRHLLAGKTTKKKRQLRGLHLVDKSDVHRIKSRLPYG